MDKPKKDESKAKGGIARAKALSPEKKKEIAEKAAAARWGPKPLQAIRKGNFQEEFGINVDCYVLGDAQKTAVISQTGMAVALGLSPRGSSFPSFINSQAMADSIGSELREKLGKPLLIQWSSGGGEQPAVMIHGHDAGLLIDVCNAVADAQRKGALGKRYEKVVQQASIINGASAKSGIKGLIYALAGYRPQIEEVIQAFKVYVQEEARKYEQEFPNELYVAWQRLYKIPMPARGKPWQFMHLTRRHVYYPLAKSQGKVLDLLRAIRAKDGEQKRYLFQFLNDIGARALRIHMGRVLEMAESSLDDAAAYEKKFNDRFGDQQELDFLPRDMPPPSTPA
jgi:hypothetical protein